MLAILAGNHSLPRRVNVLGRCYLTGRFSGVHDWPVLGVHRGAWAANAFQAFNGPQSTEWLNNPQRFKEHKDIREALTNGKIISEYIQGINRGAARSMVEEDGSCAPCDVVSFLPGIEDEEGSLTRTLIEAVKMDMPGMDPKPFTTELSQQKVQQPRRSNHTAALVSYMGSQTNGWHDVRQILRDLNIPNRAFEYLRDETDLKVRLEKIDVRYEVQGAGRGARSYFVKGIAQ